ncbi:putative sugar nucleotidyl transferase [Pinibacter aurantiacus]|uniref:Glucose-1-phosphate thymidylyltransferase n=1 Tax=Pinibacter aurantiacus TaxID=2851599 RepID=A0A9E2S6Y5_9BACT|nr:putative sugar nucleotidyl transferase [Pinibacter aurantiacus]MBV4355569.1 glucose-1-phosphate thymidylyltransferase [Pinibacter aurantiacus]
MEKIIFTEEFCQPQKLFPFTLTRHVQDIRVGILTIREKWEAYLGLPSFNKWLDNYKDNSLSIKTNELSPGDYLLIHSNVLPSAKIISQIRKLNPGELLLCAVNGPVALKFSNRDASANDIKVSKTILLEEEAKTISQPWHIFQLNDAAIREDFHLLTNGRTSQPICSTNKTIAPENIFIEQGAKVEHCILNASTGPIYIGRNAEIMEGSIIRGPLAMCEGAVLKLGTKAYGATTLGPYSVGGGEIKNSVFFGYSNKGHDGYLGDSVIGEWCNMGAGTSNSNVKNNAGAVKVYSDLEKNTYETAGIKCGVLMGDYSRCAINTSFNTGTVVGVSVNIFGSGLTPKYVPSFSWGSEGIKTYNFDAALQHIENWKQLKHQTMTAEEKSILKYLYENQ